MGNELTGFQWELFDKYCDEVTLMWTEDTRASCNLLTKTIYMNKYKYWHPTIRTTFGFVHEYGHIATNSIFMPLWEKEYLATQWAIDYCKENGLALDTETKVTYNKYIKDCIKEDPRRGLKVKNSTKAVLVW